METYLIGCFRFRPVTLSDTNWYLCLVSHTAQSPVAGFSIFGRVFGRVFEENGEICICLDASLMTGSKTYNNRYSLRDIIYRWGDFLSMVRYGK